MSGSQQLQECRNKAVLNGLAVSHIYSQLELQ